MSNIEENYNEPYCTNKHNYKSCFISNKQKKLCLNISDSLVEILKTSCNEKQICRLMEKNVSLIFKEIPRAKYITLSLNKDSLIDYHYLIKLFLKQELYKFWIVLVSKIENFNRHEYENINKLNVTPKCLECKHYKEIKKTCKCNHPNEIINKCLQVKPLILSKEEIQSLKQEMHKEISKYGNMISCPLTEEEIEKYYRDMVFWD